MIPKSIIFGGYIILFDDTILFECTDRWDRRVNMDTLLMKGKRMTYFIMMPIY